MEPQFTLEELLAEKARRQQAKQGPQQLNVSMPPKVAQPQSQDTFLGGMLEKLGVGGLRNSLYGALASAASGKVVDPRGENYNDLMKLYQQEAIKKQFEKRSPYDDLIEKSKAIEAAKSTGNRGLYDSLMGSGVQMQSQPEQNQVGLTGSQQPPNMVAPEIDPFTGKPSSMGVQQEFNNKMIEQQAIQDMKAKSPTAKQKDDLANINNVETLLLNMEKDAQSVPAGYGGVLSQVGGFITRGGSQTNTVVYNDQRKAVAVALYRALTGDTRLSDADAAARALPLLWKPDEAPEVRTMKFQKLKQLLSDRKQAVSTQLGGTENEIDADLDSNVNAMLDQLGA